MYQDHLHLPADSLNIASASENGARLLYEEIYNTDISESGLAFILPEQNLGRNTGINY